MCRSSHKTEDDTSEEEILNEDDSDNDDQSIAVPLVTKPTTPKPVKRFQTRARTNKAGVSIPTQAELARDIQCIFGSLKAFKKDPFSAKKICNPKTDLCGETGSQQRQRIRDKLKGWKKLSQQECDQVLVDIGVWASQQRPEQAIKSPPKTSTPETTTAKVSALRPAVACKKSTGFQEIRFDAPKYPKMSSNNTFTIDVNTKCPEANREVIVCDLERIPGAGEEKDTLFKGFWMTLPIDIRFIADDESTTHWKARVFSSNTVLLSIQAWDYTHLNGRDQLENAVTENVLEAIDDSQHDCAAQPSDKKEARKWKHLFLKFSDEAELSAKSIHSNAGEDENLELELVPVAVEHPKLKGVSYTTMYAAWKVARTDIKARKKGKVEKKDDKSDAARLLEMISGVSGMKIA